MSGYEKFREGLRDLYSAMARDMRVVPVEVNRKRIKKMGSDYLLNLRKEHREKNQDN